MAHLIGIMLVRFSKFVQPGAQRVATGYGSTGTVTNVAFRNPDGTLVTVVVNQTSASQAFTLRVGAQQVASTLPAKTAGTYLWAGADSGTPTSRTGRITGYGGKCVDVAAASSANGTKIQLYTCNGTAAQQWTAGANGSLVSLGKCLDATGPSSADGTALQIWSCTGADNQRWVLP
ncbi:ricin-type beta-trefoil lectin domain protein [Dactylosporangium sp. CA-233914]|uniref:ricin-type beta-trefoil lectin domain protein n=1 Tax=Dactylosporangium sp. CA-233914 TaxID=3239934 RepID=UPI003D8E7FBD